MSLIIERKKCGRHIKIFNNKMSFNIRYKINKFEIYSILFSEDVKIKDFLNIASEKHNKIHYNISGRNSSLCRY